VKNRGDFIEKKSTFLFLFVIFYLIFLVSADVPTAVEVLNSPPILKLNIPNQQWSQNSNLIEVFDLDDYFIDPNGDSINYSYAPVPNITIMINETTNKVSFYPALDFIGEYTTVFYALDSVYNTSSNPVLLTVGLDNLSPVWNSPAKSKATIFQNDVINFSTIWQDNVALRDYVFSINQGTGWANYSLVNFSGTQNISKVEVQISAPASTQIFWKFYAWDTSSNMNVTDTQTFTVASPPSVETPPPSVKNQGSAGALSNFLEELPIVPQRKLRDFRLSVYDFKLSLKQGSSKTVVLKITNIGTEDLLLNLSDVNLWDFVVFSENSFELLPGNSKEITIDFDIPRKAFVGEYYGFIRIDSGDVNKTVPVVLDVQGIDLNFDLDLTIPEAYKTVRSGGDVVANIDIFNIRDVVDVNASLYYAIKDFSGGIYNFSEEKINFTSAMSINRSLQVPIEAKEGKYVFYARISDEKNIALDSDSFEVGNKFTMNSFFKANGFFLILLLISLFLAIFMVKYQKDRRKERLINLYVVLIKLKRLIQHNKQEEAMQLFLKIRNDYKEPVSPDILKDKEKLRQELLKLYESINPEALKKINEEPPSNPINKEAQKSSITSTPSPAINPTNISASTPTKVLKKEDSLSTIKKVPVQASDKKEVVKNDK
jgi:hypothetical protein